MERGILFYFLLGAVVVGVPALTDRLLKGRVSDTRRYALSTLAVVVAVVLLVLLARPLSL